MRAYVCHVACEQGRVRRLLAFCLGKDHLPRLVIQALSLRQPTGIEDAYEVDAEQLTALLPAVRSRGGTPIDPGSLSMPAAYLLAE